MNNCPQCGKENPGGNSFCRFCGRPMGTVPQEAPMTQPINQMTEPSVLPPQYSTPDFVPQNNPQPVQAMPKKKRSRVLPAILVTLLAIFIAVVVCGVLLVRKGRRSRRKH